MNVLIPGGGGYVGAVLVPWLLGVGHRVTVYDKFWFGRAALPEDNKNLTIIKGDVRNERAFAAACAGQDAVIYLASISNNDFCEKEPQLAYDVNVSTMFSIPRIAADAGVKRFIYASSVAGYPSSDTPSVETVTLGTPTPYALGKSCGEVCSSKHEGWTVVRSASVCGPSPRMRFDLTVNMMVHDACKRGVITVNGGEQKRSHIHIYDLCDFYKLLLDVGAKRIAGQIFNVVAENQKVMETAEIVREITGAEIVTQPRSDQRSYTVDGRKARDALGFVPKRTVRQAVRELKARFDSDAKGITKSWLDSMTNKHYMNIADGIF